jgi:hypothetical protein
MNDREKRDIHPMNSEEALAARFQFLIVPHGDGLDMNEDSYNEKVRQYLNNLTIEEIDGIIAIKENGILRDNLYVVPFIYARYNSIVSEEVFDKIYKMLESYPKKDNFHYLYLKDNLYRVMFEGMEDVDSAGIAFRNFKRVWTGPIIFGIVLFSVFLILHVLLSI